MPPESTELDLVGDCNACHLRAGCAGVVCGSRGESGLMVLTDRPGGEEELHAEPLRCRAGMHWRRLMSMAGLDPCTSWLTCAVKCRSPSEPGRTARDACSKWLWLEVQRARPAIIVALGKEPARLLLGGASSFRLGDWMGKFVEAPALDCTIAVWRSQASSLTAGKKSDEEAVAFLWEVKRRLDVRVRQEMVVRAGGPGRQEPTPRGGAADARGG